MPPQDPLSAHRQQPSESAAAFVKRRLGLGQFLDIFEPQHQTAYREAVERGVAKLAGHGHFEKWLAQFAALPDIDPRLDLDQPAPRSEFASEVSIERALLDFGPWKKGPFQLGNTYLDAEWRSDLKWQRLLEHLGKIEGQSVLDVGTGNGYFLFRALGSGARCVLGLEPSPHYVAQFLALSHFFPTSKLGMLPLACDEFLLGLRAFDLVLSMGVIYHRRSPLDHIAQLMSFTRPGGRVVVETIVVDGGLGYSLVPPDRYANMRNVWFVPTVPTLKCWMEKLGLQDIWLGDPIATTKQEQRSTSFCGPVSLSDALDPNHPERTVEGHPAPRRVIVSGRVKP